MPEFGLLPAKILSFLYEKETQMKDLEETIVKRKKEVDPDWYGDEADEENKKAKEDEVREITRKCKLVHKSFFDSVGAHRWQLITIDCTAMSDGSIVDTLELNFKWKVVLFRDLSSKVDVDAIGYTCG